MDLKLLGDFRFQEKLNEKELATWKSFVSVAKEFLGNNKDEIYKNFIDAFLKVYEILGCRMSLKLIFLHSNLIFILENVGAISDEQGERFY